MTTVKQVIEYMRLMPLTHIIVRKRGIMGIIALGGSFEVDDIVNRYGSMEVVRSFVVDGILYFDVC